MRDKHELALQVKKNLNISDEEFGLYEEMQVLKDVWNEVISDLSLPPRYELLAKMFAASFTDPSNPTHANMLCTYSPEEGRFVPLKIKETSKTKEGAISFLTQIDAVLKSGVKIYDFNYLNGINSEGRASIYKPSKSGIGVKLTYQSLDKVKDPQMPEPVAEPGILKRWTNKLFGWFSREVETYNTYTAQKAEYEKNIEDNKYLRRALQKVKTETLSSILTRESKRKAYININEKTDACLTKEEKLEKNAGEEHECNEVIEVVTGRSNKLIGRHQNYKSLIEIPLEKNEALPMAGLALLVSNSITINKDIADASSQYTQTFEPRPGQSFTDEEKKIIKECSRYSIIINSGTKIMDSFYGGNDVFRMGDRGTAVVEGRKKLNEAQHAYSRGDKEPLVTLIKDSLPVIYDCVLSSINTLVEGQGKAVVEIGHAIKKLFTDDPELKTMVGFPDNKLKAIYGAANYIEGFASPVEKRYESFKKNLASGTENKEAYLKDILYQEYLFTRIGKEIRNNDREAADASIAAYDSKIERLQAKINDPGMSFTNFFTAFSKAKVFKPADLYLKFADEPVDDSQLRKQFEEEVLNGPEYKRLLSMDKEELAGFSTSELMKNINKRIEKEADERIKKEAEIKKEIKNLKTKHSIRDAEKMSPAQIKQAEYTKDNQNMLEQRASYNYGVDDIRVEAKKRLGLVKEDIDTSKPVNPKDYYIKQQKKLGDMLNNPGKFIINEDNPRDNNGYLHNLGRCIGRMIAAKQVEDYVRKNADNLTEDEKKALCSAGNIERNAKQIASSQSMHILCNKTNPFLTKGHICKLAIGAENILDKNQPKGTEPTKLSGAALADITEKIGNVTAAIAPVDGILKEMRQPVKSNENLPGLKNI